MEIIQRKITELISAEYNPRKLNEKQFTELKDSLLRFGIVDPVLVNINEGRKDIIIGGHQRTKVWASMGNLVIPCIELDLTLEKERELNVRLNQNTGEFDQELLVEFFGKDELGEWGMDTNFFDDVITEVDSGDGEQKAKTLVERFGVPPFSILDTKQGYWQKRKKEWQALGIKSEEGRDAVCNTKASTFKGSAQSQSEVLNTGTSIFDPVVCEISYRWFCKDNGVILDPFAGGSVRGIVASKLGYQYYGNDLREEQILANRENAINVLEDEEKQPVWTTGDSLNIKKLQKGVEADLIFSCPPYADLEVYSDQEEDLSNMDYKDFVEVYTQIIKESCDMLKEDSFAVWVIGEVRSKKGGYYNFVGDTIKAFMDAGMYYYNEMILATPVGTVAMQTSRNFPISRKIGKAHQNVLVFYKGDIKKIKDNFGDLDLSILDDFIPEEDVD